MKNISGFALNTLLFTALFFGAFWLLRPYLFRPDVTVVGYIKMADGLGRQSAELIDALSETLSINFLPTQKSCFENVSKQVKRTLARPFFRFGKVIFFEEALWRPGFTPYALLKTPQTKEQIRIAYSMLESTAIPQEWISILNSYFDAVAVPDPFLVEVYQKSGVTLPIFVLPLALDLDPFLQQPLKTEAHTPFVFGNLGTCTSRKNQVGIVQAFAKAFGNSDKVSLLINCRICSDNSKDLIKKEIRRLGLHNVRFTTLSLDNPAYLRLFQTVDCLVSLSKGEGFSIQPREAMALGIPVIASDNSAQKTLCKTSLVHSVPTTGWEPAIYPWGGPFGDFALCDVEDSAQAMKEVYQNYSSYLARASEMRKWAAQYQYKNLKPIYKTLIHPKKVVLGTSNQIQNDTLITNSEALYRKYHTLLHL